MFQVLFIDQLQVNEFTTAMPVFRYPIDIAGPLINTYEQADSTVGDLLIISCYGRILT